MLAFTWLSCFHILSSLKWGGLQIKAVAENWPSSSSQPTFICIGCFLRAFPSPLLKLSALLAIVSFQIMVIYYGEHNCFDGKIMLGPYLGTSQSPTSPLTICLIYYFYRIRNRSTGVPSRNYSVTAIKNQTKWPIELWTLKQEMETDDDHATMRESFSLVHNILFIDYIDILPAH